MLLDTHVLLWVVTDSPRLGRTTAAAIREAPRVCFSAVSITEIRIKQMLGKLQVPDDLPRLVASQGLVGLPLSAEQADGILHLPDLVRHDPFDRLLLAQAASERMSFLTADARLTALGLSWVLDASQ